MNSKRAELQRQIDAAQAEYNDIMDRIEEYRYNLKRLKTAKQNVIEQKSLFREIKRNHKRLFNQKVEWEGGQYQAFRVKMIHIEDSSDNYYRYSLDYILDSINDEITRLENQVLNELGIIGKLSTVINSIKNEIENAMN